MKTSKRVACRTSSVSPCGFIGSLKDISVKASEMQNPTMLQRLKSLIEWFSRLEELFVGDPDGAIKRISVLEIELRALKSGTREIHPKGRHLDALI
jgi:hypothetical protein